MFIHNESTNIFTNPKTKTLLIINLIINFILFVLSSGFLYKNKPYITPVKIAEKVNPGKYGPNGNKIAPIKSPSPAIIAA